MVVRDLGRDMVRNVGLRDTVSEVRADPAHDAAAVAEEVAVERRKRTTGERELGGTVVGQERVGVLEEGDEHQPVVNPVTQLSTQNRYACPGKTYQRYGTR